MREGDREGRKYVELVSRLLGLPIPEERMAQVWELVQKNMVAGRAMNRVPLEKQDDPYAFLRLREAGKGDEHEGA